MPDRPLTLCRAWTKECAGCGYHYTREQVRLSNCPACHHTRACQEYDCKTHCQATLRNCPCGHRFGGKDNPEIECPVCTRPRVCPVPRVSGTSACRMHGGASVRSLRSKQFRTGIYAKAMPKGVQRNFEAISKDPELLVMRKEIALLTHRVEELLERVYREGGEGEPEGPVASAERWREVKKHWREYKLASRSAKGEDKAAFHFDLLDELIAAGAADYDAWEEIERIADRIRKLKAAESRRIVEQHQVYTAEQLAVFMASISAVAIEVITQNIEEGERQNTILSELADRLESIALADSNAASEGTLTAPDHRQRRVRPPALPA